MLPSVLQVLGTLLRERRECRLDCGLERGERGLAPGSGVVYLSWLINIYRTCAIVIPISFRSGIVNQLVDESVNVEQKFYQATATASIAPPTTELTDNEVWR